MRIFASTKIRRLRFPVLLLISGLTLLSLYLYLFIQSQRNANIWRWRLRNHGSQTKPLERVYPPRPLQRPLHAGGSPRSRSWKSEVADRQKSEEHNDSMNEDNNSGPVRYKYPPRVNMGPCPPLFGRVTVLVIVVESSYRNHYAVAQRSLECYLRSTNYTFKLVDLDHDKRVNRHCKHDQLFFKKHCAVSVYLPDSDWTLVLDADAGVVNPNHCIEEWIDGRVDLVFYERFFNWEVASGNYLARNSPFARDFTMQWANMQYTQPKSFNGADNGALQLHILRTVIPGARAEAKTCQLIWQLSDSYERYMGYVTCVKTALGATRLWPGKLRILRRAHAWVRDYYMTSDAWADLDFMLHGWKAQDLSSNWKSPFTRVLNPAECTDGYAGWYWRIANFRGGSGPPVGPIGAQLRARLPRTGPPVGPSPGAGRGRMLPVLR